MRNIPVYIYEDGTLSLISNGTVPTPLHLLKPQQAFTFVESLPKEQQALAGFQFTDLTGDGSQVILYLDTFDYIAGRVDTEGGFQYLAPKDFFAITGLTPAEISIGSPSLSPASDPKKQMQKFQDLIPLVQKACQLLPGATVNFIQPQQTGGLGEATITAVEYASFNYDNRAALIEAIQACDSFTVEQGDNPGEVHLCFFVDDCLDLGF